MLTATPDSGHDSPVPLLLALAPALALIRSRMNTPQIYFDHEELVACQRSIQFVAWANQILSAQM
jgi:hypothetical protein